jgi:hypothetical protein
MTIANIEIPGTTRNALVIVKNGKSTYIDLDDEMMRAIFAPAVAAVEAGERELRGDVVGTGKNDNT